jgi:hypothetical protein
MYLEDMDKLVKWLANRKVHHLVLKRVELTVSRMVLKKARSLVQKMVKHLVQRKAQSLVLMKVEVKPSWMALTKARH